MVGEPWLCYRGDSKHGSTSYGHHPAQPHMKTKPSCFHRALGAKRRRHAFKFSERRHGEEDGPICKCIKAMCIGR
ncbi:hypothetical protein NC652_006889 [Populus alba x Populus x berolinensis]|nr:hypothetical protein NC651_006655 [Populus alba x Populus x berolinensis]KAJ6955612.1 hypothetical protein NC652_006889 [Populus alba x Populus x berolinensis]